MKQEGIQKTNFVVNLLSGLVLVKKKQQTTLITANVLGVGMYGNLFT